MITVLTFYNNASENDFHIRELVMFHIVLQLGLSWSLHIPYPVAWKKWCEIYHLAFSSGNHSDKDIQILILRLETCMNRSWSPW